MDASGIKDWIGVLGTLGGAIVGGVIAFYMSSRQQSHQRQLEREKRLIEKFEQIHEVFGEVTGHGITCAATVIANVGGNQPIDLAKFDGMKRLDHLRMLVDFYAPSLKAEAEAVKTGCGKAVRLAAEAISESQRTAEWKSRVGMAAAELPPELSSQCEAARKKLSVLMESLTK